MQTKYGEIVTIGDVLRFFAQNWALVLAITGLIVGWVRIENRIEQNSFRIDILQTETETVGDDIKAFRSDIVEIKTSLKFIEQRLTGQQND